MDRKRRLCHQMAGNDDIGGSGMVDVRHQSHRRRLNAVIDDFVADSDLHAIPSRIMDFGPGVRFGLW